jgi:hypothetical protein
MKAKKYLSLLSVAVFSIFGFYTVFSGIRMMVGFGAGFNVFGVFALLLGLLLIGFAVLCYLFFYKKENPYYLMGGSAIIIFLVLVLDVVGMFTSGSSGVDQLALLALAAIFIYGLQLYQQMVAEGKIVRPVAGAAAPQASPEEALKKLASLKEAGLITQEEFDQKRKEYISKM